MWWANSLEKTLMLEKIEGRRGVTGWDGWMASLTQETWIWANSDWITTTIHLHIKFLKYSVQFSCSVMSDSFRPYESQHARPPCPSPSPRVHSNSCHSSRWCHPAISSSVIPFSSCPQSLPSLESFPMSQLFAWGGQSTRVSASASVLPMNTQNWSPLEWTGWISLQSKGLSRFSKWLQLKRALF